MLISLHYHLSFLYLGHFGQMNNNAKSGVFSILGLTYIRIIKSSMAGIIRATSRENVSSGIFDQVRFKLACSATETSKNLELLDIASIHIILSKQQTTKVLIRLRGCTGWSAPLLIAYGIRHIFAWPGPYLCRILVPILGNREKIVGLKFQ